MNMINKYKMINIIFKLILKNKIHMTIKLKKKIIMKIKI